MDGKVDIRVEIDPAYEEPRVIIQADRRSERIDRIVEAVERCLNGRDSQLTVYRGDTLVLMDQDKIIRVYTENRRLILCTDSGIYEAKHTLRELEEMLDAEYFVRISRFEIINLSKTAGFDLSMAGTIRVSFEDGTETWVARRYVRTIQEKLRNKRKGGAADE